jgi:hypothetical protein
MQKGAQAIDKFIVMREKRRMGGALENMQA